MYILHTPGNERVHDKQDYISHFSQLSGCINFVEFEGCFVHVTG